MSNNQGNPKLPMWVVVEFVGLNYCEVASASWLVGNDQCRWPPNASAATLEQAIIRHRKYEDTWETRDVVILGNGKRFDKYSKAKGLAKKAEDEDNPMPSESDGSVWGRGSRRRRLPKSLSSSVVIQKQKTKKNSKPKSLPPPGSDDDSSSKHGETSSDDESGRRVTPSPPPELRGNTGSSVLGPSQQIVATPGPSSVLAVKRRRIEDPDVEVSPQKNNATTPTASPNPIAIPEFQTQQEYWKWSAVRLIRISAILKLHSEDLDLIMAHVGKDETTGDKRARVTVAAATIPVALPLKSKEDMKKLKKWAKKDVVNTKELKNKLRRGNHGSVKGQTTASCEVLMSNSFAVGYNWGGQRGKIGFQDTWMKNILYECITEMSRFKNIKEVEKKVKKTVQTWLAGAKRRLKPEEGSRGDGTTSEEEENESDAGDEDGGGN